MGRRYFQPRAPRLSLALCDPQAIPEILAGRDTLICSETGSGKTLSYLVPLLQRLAVAPTDAAASSDSSPPVAAAGVSAGAGGGEVAGDDADSDSDRDGFDTLEDFLMEGGGAGDPGTIGVVTEAEIAAMAAAGLPVSPASTSAGRAGTINNKGKGKGKGKEVEGKGGAGADSEDGPRVLPKVIVLVPTQELVYQVLEVVKVVQPQLGSLVQVCIGMACDAWICQVEHDHRNTLLAPTPTPPTTQNLHSSTYSSPRFTQHRTLPPPPSPCTHP